MLRLIVATLFLVAGSTMVGSTIYAQEAAAPSVQAEQTLKPKIVERSKVATDSPATTVCTNGSNKRIVEITYGSAENKLPCEVHYKKETEQAGHDQVIYSANSDLQYCYEKAAAHVEKLEGFGWSCSKG
jgi:hypothetical protein